MWAGSKPGQAGRGISPKRPRKAGEGVLGVAASTDPLGAQKRARPRACPFACVGTRRVGQAQRRAKRFGGHVLLSAWLCDSTSCTGFPP